MNRAEECNLARRLGLVGGFGISAGVYYYRELAKACEALGIVLDLVLIHADINTAREYVDSKDREGLAEYLADLIGFAKGAGAEFAAIAAVTPHLCIDELRPRLSLPLVDPLQCARDAVGSRRVALFGTRYTIESDMFGALHG
jgi:aspartate racemase